MKRKILVFALLLGLLPAVLWAGNRSENRIGISFVLSGHLLFGVKVQHFFDAQNCVQATFYPLLIPGKKFPFAFGLGYNYFTNGQHWQGKLGAEFAMIVSPPDPQKRKVLPMLNFTPGFRYVRQNGQSIGGNLWLSYFLKKTRHKIAPTGLEFWYDFNW